MRGQQQKHGGKTVGSARSNDDSMEYSKGKSVGSGRSKNDSMEYSKAGTDVSSFGLSTINTTITEGTIFPLLKDNDSVLEGYSMDGDSMDGYSMDGYSMTSVYTSDSNSLMGEKFLNTSSSSSRGKSIPKNTSLLGEIGTTTNKDDHDDNDSIVGLGGDQDEDLYYDVKKGSSAASSSSLPSSHWQPRKVTTTIPVSDSDSESAVEFDDKSQDEEVSAHDNESKTVLDRSLVTISRKDLAQLIDDAVEQRMIEMEALIKRMVLEETDEIRTLLLGEI